MSQKEKTKANSITNTPKLRPWERCTSKAIQNPKGSSMIYAWMGKGNLYREGDILIWGGPFILYQKYDINSS